MACGRVADFVDTLHDGVERCVIAYGGVCAVEVIVDGAGKTDDREIEFVGEDAGAGERAVAADHHKCVDFVALDVVESELAPFGGGEFLAAGSLQNSAAGLNDIGNVLSVKFLNLIGDEAAVAAIYTFDLKTSVDSRAGYGADCGVHAGGVSSGSQDAYTFDFCHNS